MATEITEHDPNGSPGHDDQNNGNVVDAASRGLKRSRAAADDDDDDDDKPGRERRKIEIKFIQDKSRRHITFSKRKAGIMKKVSRTFAVQSLRIHFHRVVLHCTASFAHAGANDRVALGLRIVCPHRHPGPAPRRLRDRSRLHLHNAKAATTGHQARRQEPDSGKLLIASTLT